MTIRDNPETAKVHSDFQAQEHGRRDGEPAIYTCPECGGTLWRFNEGYLVRLRCHVGHVYSESTFVDDATRVLEATMWRMVREFAEKASIARMLAQQQTNARSRAWYEDRAKDLEHAKDQLRHTMTRLIPLTAVPLEPSS